MRSLQKKRLSLTVILFLLPLLLFLLTAILSPLRFRHLTKTLFQEEMKRDALSMHYTIAAPEDYGIPSDWAYLSPYSEENTALSRKQQKDFSRSLSTILPFFLNHEDRLLYHMLKEQLSLQPSAQDFSLYAEPLSPGSGIVSNLPVLLAEYSFRREADVKNYLSILSQIPDYLAGIAAYEQEKAQAGLFMSDPAANQLILQCQTIMDAQNLMQNTHFLNTTFSERLKVLIEKKELTPSQAASYEAQNHRLLLDNIMPAYEALGDVLCHLKGSGSNPDGLAHFPDGRSYYTFLFQDTTGSSLSFHALKKRLLLRLKQDTEELALILKQNPDLLSAMQAEDFPAMSPDEILADLQNRIKEDFPPFPSADTLPSCTIKEVSASLADYCSPAFYLTPPIDDISENSIYINPKDVPDALELYTTLAHEGYPGHLYQTVYEQLDGQKKNRLPLRSLLRCSGYAEGWALYVEMLSYDYAKELLKEHHSSDDMLLFVDVLRLNRSIQLCLYSLLDIKIHYDGITCKDAAKYLNAFGITDSKTVSDIYRYIVQEPAVYPKYYVGYLEFLQLKEDARAKWKEDYSDYRFHKFVLDTGSCSFSLLRRQL